MYFKCQGKGSAVRVRNLSARHGNASILLGVCVGEGQLCAIFSGTVVPFSFERSWSVERAFGTFPCSLYGH